MTRHAEIGGIVLIDPPTGPRGIANGRANLSLSTISHDAPIAELEIPGRSAPVKAPSSI